MATVSYGRAGPYKRQMGNGYLELGWDLVLAMARPLCRLKQVLSGPHSLHLNKRRGLISDILGCCEMSLLTGRRAVPGRTVWGLQRAPWLLDMSESEI